MQTSSYRAAFKSGWIVLALVFAMPLSLSAQQTPFAAALKSTSTMPVAPASSPMAFSTTTTHRMERPHRFWDNENKFLFVSMAALGTADFFVTRANLASGGHELNPITGVLSGSTPGLAANFALQTSGVIGVSYFFHRTGHHRLERLTSVVNIGGSATAVGYDLAHR